MKTIRRWILLILFTAAGVGLALGVGLSLEPPEPSSAGCAGREGSPPARLSAGTAGPTCPASKPSAQKPSDAAPECSRLRPTPPPYPAAAWGLQHPAITVPTAPMIAAPMIAAAYPALAGQAPSEPSSSGFGRLLEYLKGSLVSANERSAPGEASSAAESIPRPRGAPAGPAAQSTGSTIVGEGDGRLTINIYDEDIRTVLDLLSEQGNLNILPSSSVKGNVSATLKGVDVQSALDAILRSTGFVAKRDGQFIFVGTPEDFTAMEQAMDKVGTRVYRPNYVKAEELQTLITPLLTEGVGVASITSAAETGIPSDGSSAGGDSYAGGEALLVRDYEAVLAQIDQIVAEIDVRPMQVHIEAMILSVKLNDKNSFGVDFELLRKNNNLRFGWGTPASSLATFKFDDGGLKFAFLDENLGAFLDALETVGDTSVIATPRLMVLNKHRAEIQIGKSKGYLSTTQTETATTQSVEFLELGTLLRLRPFISSDGMIRLEVHPELSDGEVLVEKGFTLPNKEVTQVTTNIMVRDGCTVVIGGLLKDELKTTRTQIPLLGNLPVVGVAFRRKIETIERHEVIVLITPRIVYEPDTCREGDKAACEYQRRQSVYAEKMSSIGKRSLARRYFRKAQKAYAIGDRDRALHLAEMAVHFDPLNRAAIELRSDIWLDTGRGDYTMPPGEGYVVPPMENPMENPTANPTANPLDGDVIAPWLLEDLRRETPPVLRPLHPIDPGQSGGHRDIVQPRRLQ